MAPASSEHAPEPRTRRPHPIRRKKPRKVTFAHRSASSGIPSDPPAESDELRPSDGSPGRKGRTPTPGEERENTARSTNTPPHQPQTNTPPPPAQPNTTRLADLHLQMGELYAHDGRVDFESLSTLHELLAECYRLPEEALAVDHRAADSVGVALQGTGPRFAALADAHERAADALRSEEAAEAEEAAVGREGAAADGGKTAEAIWLDLFGRMEGFEEQDPRLSARRGCLATIADGIMRRRLEALERRSRTRRAGVRRVWETAVRIDERLDAVDTWRCFVAERVRDVGEKMDGLGRGARTEGRGCC